MNEKVYRANRENNRPYTSKRNIKGYRGEPEISTLLGTTFNAFKPVETPIVTPIKIQKPKLSRVIQPAKTYTIDGREVRLAISSIAGMPLGFKDEVINSFICDLVKELNPINILIFKKILDNQLKDLAALISAEDYPENFNKKAKVFLNALEYKLRKVLDNGPTSDLNIKSEKKAATMSNQILLNIFNLEIKLLSFKYDETIRQKSPDSFAILLRHKLFSRYEALAEIEYRFKMLRNQLDYMEKEILKPNKELNNLSVKRTLRNIEKYCDII